MLAKGGNAIDAAIATSLALGVCEPSGSGLGGMATMVYYQADKQKLITIEGPCTAPLSATTEKVSQQNRYRGYAAIAVPSNVATLEFARSRFGTLSTAELCAPAITIADEGFPVTHSLNKLLHQYQSALSKHSAGQVFLDAGKPRAVGQQLRQPALANTLKRLASAGFDDFYQGETAARIVADMANNDGFVGADDLKNTPLPSIKQPIVGDLGDLRVASVGPPAGGMALIQMVQLVTSSGKPDYDLSSPEDVVFLANLIRLVRSQRRIYRLKFGCDEPGDAAALIDRDYNQSLFDDQLAYAEPTGETSHISVVDRWGNAVAWTQSIERSFGSGIMTGDLGFCYNGYMRAFKVENKKHPHYLRPGVPARSNASPTIVTDNGVPIAVLGSTGSERMASGILTTLLALQSSDPFSAVHQPRLHCTPEKLVTLEVDRFPQAVTDALTESGFQVDPTDAYSFRMGGLQMIAINDDRLTGVADPRRDGAALSP